MKVLRILVPILLFIDALAISTMLHHWDYKGIYGFAMSAREWILCEVIGGILLLLTWIGIEIYRLHSRLVRMEFRLKAIEVLQKGKP